MKKIVLLIVVLLFGLINIVYAQSNITANASPATVGVNTTTTYVNITFPYPTRNLLIQNNDSADYVYVDLKSDTNTVNISSCFLLAPNEEINLFDFITSGISILRDTVYSTGDTASPISVIATY